MRNQGENFATSGEDEDHHQAETKPFNNKRRGREFDPKNLTLTSSDSDIEKYQNTYIDNKDSTDLPI